jgi:hypothetical protein
MLTTAAASMTCTDLLLLTPLALWGFYLALAQGCPLIVLGPIPIIATADFDSAIPWPARPTTAQQNRAATETAAEPIHLSQRQPAEVPTRQQGHPAIALAEAWRRCPGAARNRRAAPAQLASPAVLHLFSPQVLARPADWQESASVAGCCVLESRSATGEILACNYQHPLNHS